MKAPLTALPRSRPLLTACEQAEAPAASTLTVSYRRRSDADALRDFFSALVREIPAVPYSQRTERLDRLH